MTTIDLKKAIKVTRWYENQYGNTTPNAPPHYSTFGIPFLPHDYALPHCEYPSELNLERARRLMILDIWVPKIKVVFSTSRSSRFSGERALRIWEKWNGMIYGKGK